MKKIVAFVKSLAAKPVVERAFHAAWQSGLAVVIADSAHIGSLTLWQGAFVAAAASGASVVKTYLVNN